MASEISAAAAYVADQLFQPLGNLFASLGDNTHPYVIVLAVTDDFSSITAHYHTEEQLSARLATADSEISPHLQKWYFGQWDAEFMDLETGPMSELLGDATEGDEDAKQLKCQAAWLWAIAEGLRQVRSQGRLTIRGTPVLAFCSMIDSSNAVWIEKESAQYINGRSSYDAVASELADSSAAWYSDIPKKPSKLQRAFTKARPAEPGAAADGGGM